MSDLIPDGISPIQAYRVWRLNPLVNTDCNLYSLNEALWIPQKPIHASCFRYGVAAHSSPETSCTCGIWGTKELEYLPIFKHGAVYGVRNNCGVYGGYYDIINDVEHFAVVGQTSMWGKMIEYDLGWRSEFAYPTKLFVSGKNELDALLSKIVMFYNIPLKHWLET